MLLRTVLFMCLISWILAEEKPITCKRTANTSQSLVSCLKSLAYNLVPDSPQPGNNNTYCKDMDDLLRLRETKKFNSNCSVALNNYNANIDAFVGMYNFTLSEIKLKEFRDIDKDCVWKAKIKIEECVKTILRIDENTTFGQQHSVHTRFNNETCFGNRSISVIQNCVLEELSGCSNKTRKYVGSLFNEALSTCLSFEKLNKMQKSTIQSIVQRTSEIPDSGMNTALKVILIILSIVVFIALVFYIVRWFRLRPVD